MCRGLSASPSRHSASRTGVCRYSSVMPLTPGTYEKSSASRSMLLWNSSQRFASQISKWSVLPMSTTSLSRPASSRCPCLEAFGGVDRQELVLGAGDHDELGFLGQCLAKRRWKRQTALGIDFVAVFAEQSGHGTLPPSPHRMHSIEWSHSIPLSPTSQRKSPTLMSCSPLFSPRRPARRHAEPSPGKI